MPSLPVHRAVLDYDVSSPLAVLGAPGAPARTAVQLHGLTSSRARDAHLGFDLCRSARSHRVIRYDARGHGRSTGDRDAAAYGWDALAGDLVTLLDAQTPDTSVHGVGQSMGAGTLLHAAVAQPGRFASLVLGIPPTAWASRVPQREAYLAQADMVERQGVESLIALSPDAIRPPAVAPDTPLTVPAVEADLLPTVFRGAAATDLPSPESIAALGIPTLLLAWVQDPAHPLSTAQRLHELLPASSLVVARTPADVATWPSLVAAHCERWT